MAWTTPGTATAGNVLTAAFWNEQVRDNSVMLAPFFAAWTAYTPVWSGLTIGNGTTSGRYLKVGRMVTVVAQLNWGSTSTGSGSFTCTMPVTAATFSGGVWVGSCRISDAGTKGFVATVEVASNGTGLSRIVSADSGAGAAEVTSTNPMTWANGDALYFTITYEAAS